jgi:hypothetical protein
VEQATRPVALTFSDPTATSDGPALTSTSQADSADSAAGGGGGPSVGGGSGGAAGGSDGVVLPPSEPVSVTAADDELLRGAVGARTGPADLEERLGAAFSEEPTISPLFGDPVAVAAPFGDPLAEATPSGVPLSGAGGTPVAVDDGILDTIAETATDPNVLAGTGVALLIGVRLGSSGLLCPEEARLMFTNVRLLPCLVRDGVSRQLAELTSALPATGPAAPVAALSPGLASETAATAATGSGPDAVAGGSGDVRGAWQLLRDGFDQAVRGGGREIGDGLGDSRLLIQLGMALGFVYAAFLSVWFWATRLRRRPSGERGHA